MSAARSLLPVRRAAALLLADDYMTCMGHLLDQSRERFVALGAEFNWRMRVEDGGDYSHTFRKEARNLIQTDWIWRVGATGRILLGLIVPWKAVRRLLPGRKNCCCDSPNGVHSCTT